VKSKLKIYHLHLKRASLGVLQFTALIKDFS